MPLPDNLALFGAAGCGCHQQVFAIVSPGGEPPALLATIDFQNGEYTHGETSYTLAETVETDGYWTGGWQAGDVQEGVGYAPSVFAGGKLIAPFSTTALADCIYLSNISLSAGGLVALVRYETGADTYEEIKIAAQPTDSQVTRDDGFPLPISGIEAGDHLVAVLISDTETSFSVDGGPINQTSQSATTSKTVLVFMVDDAVFRSVALYDGSGGPGSLQALSAG